MTAAGAPVWTVPSRTIARQRQAADPVGSAWVSANAGSGKTYVLARRVVRLLLAGADPASILCLTFTKAAAAEMANRVFAILGAWAVLSDDNLASEIEKMTGAEPATEDMTRARRLFAAAIETPGRLKIQTVHAFSERILQLFPFEAGVPSSFTVLDERAAEERLREAERRVFTIAEDDPAGGIAQALWAIADAASDAATAEAIRVLVADRSKLMRWNQRAADHGTTRADSLRRLLGLPPDASRASVIDDILDGPNLPRSRWLDAATTLRQTGKPQPIGLAKALEEAHAAALPDDAASLYLAAILTKDGRVRKKLVTGAIRDADANLADRLEAEGPRLAPLLDQLKCTTLVDLNDALFVIADAILDRYRRLKQLEGALDFADLIERAASLLSRSDAAQWVLYKLDAGLDHILVDEAQDTSPVQWDIIGALTDEFFAGQTKRDAARSLFAVGDPKQSIYSFQGAEPEAFDRMRRQFGNRIDAARRRFSDISLGLSFRSTPHVLKAVDQVFDAGPAAASLGPAERYTHHEALRHAAPGRVEIWPTEVPVASEEPDAWDAPLDAPRLDAPEVRLARRIAAAIRHWLDTGARLDGTGQVIRPKDIMILVRKRNPFAEPMIRALKERSIPVAGADRLAVTAHIAVQDLMALGRACLLPADDLSLAALLKSPLFGVSEDELFALCHDRQGALIDTLERDAASDPRLADIATRLSRWRRRARTLKPYDFYAEVLTSGGGFRAYAHHLGVEAEEALDAFLVLARNFERVDTPTLVGFLHWLAAGETELKRDMEQPEDEGDGAVRVMTVHGAKGLEAPIVFLPDTCSLPTDRNDSPVYAFPGPDPMDPPDALIWVPRRDMSPEAVDRLREVRAEAKRREYYRLLYVAMTRAADSLYVAGFEGKQKGVEEGSWYDLIGKSLGPDLRSAPADHDAAPVARFEPADLPTQPLDARDPADRHRAPVAPPAWLWQSVAGEEAKTRFRQAASRRPGRDTGTARARRRGKLIHALFEHLPEVVPQARRDAAIRFLATRATGWSDPERATVVDAVLAVVDNEAFAPVFGPGGRAEVSVAGRVATEDGEAQVQGRVDRLVVTDDVVLIVDFKTAESPPDAPAETPPDMLAQLATYRALVAGAYPGRIIRQAIVWTAGPVLVEIPDNLLPQISVAARSS